MSENAVLEIGRARLQPQRIELGRGDQNEVDGRRERCEAPGSALVSAHVPCGSRRSRGACRSTTRHATRGVTVCDACLVGRRGRSAKVAQKGGQKTIGRATPAETGGGGVRHMTTSVAPTPGVS